MSELSLIASKISITQKSSENFDKALTIAKKRQIGEDISDGDIGWSNKVLTEVLKSLEHVVKDEYNPINTVPGTNVAMTLRSRYKSRWGDIENQIHYLLEIITSEDKFFQKEEILLLEDIADALDTECALLFQKMQGRL